MPTTLNLLASQNNGIGANYFDMTTDVAASLTIFTVNTAASGTEIQWTQSAGGAVAQWVSGRVPAGGFTLTSATISISATESNMNANCGGRCRLFKRTAAGVETELGGGPFNDGVEFGTSPGLFAWVCNVTDTAFAEDDRIVLKVYITNVGTMAAGHTCDLRFNNSTGVFLELAETVTFKAEAQNYSLPIAQASYALTANAVGLLRGRRFAIDPASYTLSAQTVGLAKGFRLAVAQASYALTLSALGLRATRGLPVAATSFALTTQAIGLRYGRRLALAPASLVLTANDIGLIFAGAAESIVVDAASYAMTVNALGLRVGRKLQVQPASYLLTASALDLIYTPGPQHYTLFVDRTNIMLIMGETHARHEFPPPNTPLRLRIPEFQIRPRRNPFLRPPR